MEIRLAHLYPDLMNLYGSYGNVAVLRRLLERLGHTVTVERVDPVRYGPAPALAAETEAAPALAAETEAAPALAAETEAAPAADPASGDMADCGADSAASGVTADSGAAADTDGAEQNAAILQGCDFLFLGAGTERRQRFAMGDLSQYAALLRTLAEDGLPMLFAGTGMELSGRTVTTAEGESYAGIGIADFHTVQQSRRIVGDVYGKTDLFADAVVGFMNKSAEIRGIETPLLTSLSMGFGNESEHGPEGFHRWNVYGSELTGPILVKNPRLLTRIAAAILERKSVDLPAQWPLDPWAEKGYAVTEAALKLRCGGT